MSGADTPVDAVGRHYERSLARHGATAEGMDWKDAASQRLRFRILCEVMDLDGLSVHEVGAACIATTATTGAAFASFATSQLGTFVRLGVISAFGVLACLVLTFTLVPIFACWTHRPKNASDSTRSGWQSMLAAVMRTTERRNRLLLGISAGLLFVCAFGWATRLRVENDWIESYGEDSEIVRAIRFVEEKMGPVDTLEVDVLVPTDFALQDAAQRE